MSPKPHPKAVKPNLEVETDFEHTTRRSFGDIANPFPGPRATISFFSDQKPSSDDDEDASSSRESLHDIQQWFQQEGKGDGEEEDEGFLRGSICDTGGWFSSEDEDESGEKKHTKPKKNRRASFSAPSKRRDGLSKHQQRSSSSLPTFTTQRSLEMTLPYINIIKILIDDYEYKKSLHDTLRTSLEKEEEELQTICADLTRPIESFVIALDSEINPSHVDEEMPPQERESTSPNILATTLLTRLETAYGPSTRGIEQSGLLPCSANLLASYIHAYAQTKHRNKSDAFDRSLWESLLCSCTQIDGIPPEIDHQLQQLGFNETQKEKIRILWLEFIRSKIPAPHLIRGDTIPSEISDIITVQLDYMASRLEQAITSIGTSKFVETMESLPEQLRQQSTISQQPPSDFEETKESPDAPIKAILWQHMNNIFIYMKDRIGNKQNAVFADDVLRDIHASAWVRLLMDQDDDKQLPEPIATQLGQLKGDRPQALTKGQVKHIKNFLLKFLRAKKLAKTIYGPQQPDEVRQQLAQAIHKEGGLSPGKSKFHQIMLTAPPPRPTSIPPQCCDGRGIHTIFVMLQQIANQQHETKINQDVQDTLRSFAIITDWITQHELAGLGVSVTQPITRQCRARSFSRRQQTLDDHLAIIRESYTAWESNRTHHQFDTVIEQCNQCIAYIEKHRDTHPTLRNHIYTPQDGSSSIQSTIECYRHQKNGTFGLKKQIDKAQNELDKAAAKLQRINRHAKRMQLLLIAAVSKYLVSTRRHRQGFLTSGFDSFLHGNTGRGKATEAFTALSQATDLLSVLLASKNLLDSLSTYNNGSLAAHIAHYLGNIRKDGEQEEFTSLFDIGDNQKKHYDTVAKRTTNKFKEHLGIKDDNSATDKPANTHIATTHEQLLSEEDISELSATELASKIGQSSLTSRVGNGYAGSTSIGEAFGNKINIEWNCCLFDYTSRTIKSSTLKNRTRTMSNQLSRQINTLKIR